MVEADFRRTFGDLGEYALYGIGESTGVAGTYLGVGAVLGEEYGTKSNRAAGVSVATALGLFVLASAVESEWTGDFLATASLGAVAAAGAWSVDLSRVTGVCACNRDRRGAETNEWANPRRARARDGPRSQRRIQAERDSWGTPRSRRRETNAFTGESRRRETNAWG